MAEADAGGLGRDQRRRLLALARQTIAVALSGGDRQPPELGPPLDSPRGVFVTLERAGKLRGCIGYPRPIRPLGLAVAECARAAALEDPRFSPVDRAELDELRIEISVLSAPVPCRPEEVEVGRDGLIVSRGDRSGLLLPQVAFDRRWDRERFLGETCRKAGLPADAWRGDAALERFSAEVFGESE